MTRQRPALSSTPSDHRAATWQAVEHFRCGITGPGRCRAEGTAMVPPGARVWIALGHTDMRKGMQGLALLVQQGLKRNPHGGDLFVFHGRAGSLIKIV